MSRITVSFKRTSRDMKLFLYVKSLDEYSDFVKDAVEFYIKHLESKKN